LYSPYSGSNKNSRTEFSGGAVKNTTFVEVVDDTPVSLYARSVVMLVFTGAELVGIDWK
jgi:hypothetical protein